MSENMFKGVYAVVPTPLMEDEGLDNAGLQHLINYYIESSCHGILILGSGGEFPYFSYAEKIKIVQDAITVVNGRAPLLVGAGFSSFVETMAFIKEVGEMQFDGFLVITPTFFPAGFEDVFGLYSQICQESKKPILYYNYPQMTGLFFSPEQISRLLLLEGMVGMKDSIMDIKEIHQHIKSTDNSKTAILAGNSFAMRPVLDMGGSGVIEVTSSFAPRLVVDC
ncbi:MAG: dihydrodipicolinate synthase family protein, partial [Deltaproteobacteria bacterium]|nr:dihydrodipicolinate synthase family protein [Deltaproteobacteria bacterium]